MNLTLAERNSFGQIGRGAATTAPIPPLVEGFLSWQAVTWVLEQSEAELGSRLVLISIASHANREGKNAFPTLETIGRESLMCEREVRYCIRALEEKGELIVHRGIGRGNPSRYDMPRVQKWVEQIQRPGGRYATKEKGQDLPHLESVKGATDEIKGAICNTKRGNRHPTKPAESNTSPRQPLLTVKERTVKAVAKALSVPRTVKTQKELLAERDRQIAAMRAKGYIQ